MPIYYWINILFFSFFLVLALKRRSERQRYGKAIVIGILGLVFVAAPRLAARFVKPSTVSLIRDWLPGLLMLMAYWQAGEFFERPHLGWQARLESFDRPVIKAICRFRETRGWLGAIRNYLELSYLLCYPMVPAGLAVLYFAGMKDVAGEFWSAVLPAAYLCYALVPFIPTLPPRSLAAATETSAHRSEIRSLNLWILRHGSIQVNTFPSAHVSASLAVSLVMLHHVPLAGGIFLWISASIAAGAVAGRYHYLLDALTGAVVAVLSFLMATIAFA